MAWKKLGRIFNPEDHFSGAYTHASNPTPLRLQDSVYRIFFSSRDKHGHSHVFFVDFDLNYPFQSLLVCAEPVLSPGQPGSFDENGISVGCLLYIEDNLILYYSGWGSAPDQPWKNAIGMAKWDNDKGLFIRLSQEPVLAADDADPYSLSYPFVLKNEQQFLLYYGSFMQWNEAKGEVEHPVKTAISTDGFKWTKTNQVAIPVKAGSESGISRPYVFGDASGYHMWYAYRGEQYRIGHAVSENGFDWTRKDELSGIDVSAQGWDSEAVTYPYVFDHDNQRYLLYNGNQYGKTGFGLAVWE